MTQKGVNLGGWLVLERWITPSLFTGTDACDEFSLVSLGETYQARIANHYKTFITRKDIAWLHDQGVTQLRVPIGYWLFGDQTPFLSCIKYLDQLFDWTAEFDMQIILSIHAAPGSQNGKLHSGKIGETRWHTRIDQLTTFALSIARHCQTRKNFAGLGLLNEPNPSHANIVHLIRYYRHIVRRLKRQNPTLPLYIDGTFHPRLWASVALFLRVGLDLHLYHGFDKGTDANKAFNRLKRSAAFLKKLRRLPVIVGEWSGIIDVQPDEITTERYIKMQQRSYKPAAAQFYWTYKTEAGGYWSFRNTFKPNKGNR